MTQKEVQDTVIATGREFAYIANIASQVRREITEDEIIGLIAWYFRKKFKEDDCDEYAIINSAGEVSFTIRKGGTK